VAALASLGQERQLAGHARGAVRCGARPEAVRAVLEVLPDGVPDARRARAAEIVARFARFDQAQRR
jgi:alkylhydroperoxidase/carboxymuconolactone decarboxylase family protein YurZ